MNRPIDATVTEIVVTDGVPFAEHPASGVMFTLLDSGDLWCGQGELFGPVDKVAEALFDRAWPGLVGAAREALKAWHARDGDHAAHPCDELEALFAVLLRSRAGRTRPSRGRTFPGGAAAA